MRIVTAKDLYFLSVIGLLEIAAWAASRRIRECAAASISFLAYRLSREKKRRSEEHLARAFGGRMSPNRSRAIIKRAFREFWGETFSLVLSRREKRALGGVEVRGIEHLRTALQQGKGVILWESSRFGRRIVAKHILHGRGFAIHQLHAENHLGGFLNDTKPASLVREHLIKHWFEKHERDTVAETIDVPYSDSLAFTRLVLRRLQQNAIVCTAGDGPFGQKFVSVPFLGHTESFATGMVSAARMSGAAILPLFCITGRKRGTCVIIERPIRVESEMDREKALEGGLTQCVKALESYVRRHPAQYRSWHLLGSPERSSSAVEAG